MELGKLTQQKESQWGTHNMHYTNRKKATEAASGQQILKHRAYVRGNILPLF